MTAAEDAVDDLLFPLYWPRPSNPALACDGSGRYCRAATPDGDTKTPSLASEGPSAAAACRLRPILPARLRPWRLKNRLS